MGESAALKERENMNCRIAEGMVNKYIDHTLPLNDLEDFLEHIEKCSSCYDELATYFIVHKAMQQLDEKQEDTVLDFKELLEEDIRKSEKVYPEKEISQSNRCSGSLRSDRGTGGLSCFCDPGTEGGNLILSEKILLIDGHSILNRAFYGLPDLTNAEGRRYRSGIWISEYYVQDHGGKRSRSILPLHLI